jgi:hypothetical protein
MLFVGVCSAAYAQRASKKTKKVVRTADKKQEIVIEQIKQDNAKVQIRKRQRGDILAGDSIFILSPANGKEFNSIELYTKSRFVDVPLKWDTLTGEGFYEYYFTVGDFDAKPLPVDYSNTWVKIISIKSFRDRENNLVSVFFCKGKEEHQVLWLMFEKAVLSGEVEVPRPQ